MYAHPSLPRLHAVLRVWYGIFLRALPSQARPWFARTDASLCHSVSDRTHNITTLMSDKYSQICVLRTQRKRCWVISSSQLFTSWCMLAWRRGPSGSLRTPITRGIGDAAKVHPRRFQSDVDFNRTDFSSASGVRRGKKNHWTPDMPCRTPAFCRSCSGRDVRNAIIKSSQDSVKMELPRP